MDKKGEGEHLICFPLKMVHRQSSIAASFTS